MSNGAILPIYRWEVNYNGSPSPGAKAYFYLSGTSTPQDTFNNADLNPTHANTNPVVADANGILPIIYLSPVAYRVFVTTSTGITIFPAQDDIYDLFQIFQATAETANTVYAGPTSGSAAAPSFRALVAADLPSTGSILIADNGMNDFRLSLTTAVPVTTADVTAATTVYCEPYTGNRIALFNSSGVPTYYSSNEFSIAVPATTNTLYDIFCFASGGIPTLELLAWSTDTARATALVSNVAVGVYTKSGDATRRYLGSFRTTGSSGQTEDSFAKRYLWNYYHRVPRGLRVTDATNTWSYNTASYRQANNSSANQLDVVVGVAEVLLDVSVYAAVSNVDGGGVALRVAIGEDSTTAVATGTQFGPVNVNTCTTQNPFPLQAYLKKYPAVGRHTYVWLELGAATNTTWYGDGGDLTMFNQGICGTING